METRSRGFTLDETTFEIDQHQLAESASRFPDRRVTAALARPDADMTYLAAPKDGFVLHAWDECGHP